jgi:hypothetical protein
VSNSESAASHDHFSDLNDPRVERTRKHPLIDALFIAVRAVLSGANSFAAIEEFGLDRRAWFARFLDLTNGTPPRRHLRSGPGPPRPGGVRGGPVGLGPGRTGGHR